MHRARYLAATWLVNPLTEMGEVLVFQASWPLQAQGPPSVVADVGRQVENVQAKLEFWRMPLAGQPMSYRLLLGEPFADTFATPTDESPTAISTWSRGSRWWNQTPSSRGRDLPEFEPESRGCWLGAPNVSEPTDQDRVAIPCPACRDDDELFLIKQLT